MADVVRILGLDDDNHAMHFRAETGEIYKSPFELIQWLSHAHDVEYDVRAFSIAGVRTGRLENLSEDTVEAIFEQIEGLAEHPHLDFNLSFDLLWESANKWWW